MKPFDTDALLNSYRATVMMGNSVVLARQTEDNRIRKGIPHRLEGQPTLPRAEAATTTDQGIVSTAIAVEETGLQREGDEVAMPQASSAEVAEEEDEKAMHGLQRLLKTSIRSSRTL